VEESNKQNAESKIEKEDFEQGTGEVKSALAGSVVNESLRRDKSEEVKTEHQTFHDT